MAQVKAWWVIVSTDPAGKNTYTIVYDTQADAQARANLVVKQGSGNNLAGPFNTRADAQSAINSGSLANLGSAGAAQVGAHNVKQAVTNAVPGLSQIGTFFNDLTQANTWIRVGEVILGVALIIVGLARLASGTAVGKAAMKAGKVAALL